jgi:hypothetical protein
MLFIRGSQISWLLPGRHGNSPVSHWNVQDTVS